MTPITVIVLTALLALYICIERYCVTPRTFFIYYVLFSVVLSAATM